MNRVLEPELMTDAEQAAAYAAADFASVNQAFVDRFRTLFPEIDHDALPISGRAAVAAAGLGQQVRLVRARLPGLDAPAGGFDGIVSNSLLHHLPRPEVLWSEIGRLGRAGAAVLVTDLHRPESAERAREIVETYSAAEPPVLKRDFFHSLCAAFTLPEVVAQIEAAKLGNLRCEMVSDRHWAAWGRLGATSRR